MLAFAFVFSPVPLSSLVSPTIGSRRPGLHLPASCRFYLAEIRPINSPTLLSVSGA
jgi:hypothetical protein